MKMIERIRRPFIMSFAALTAAILTVSMFGCGGGGGSTTTTTTDTSINTLDGATGIPVDSTFTYTFSKAADNSTITNTSFFIIPTPASVTAQTAGKAALDESICDSTSALDAAISFGSLTSTLDPTNDLEYSSNYTVCLMTDIAYGDATAFEGVMAHFTTEAEGGGDATYTVGGTVSGLVGTVVLQNNGGDDLTITEDGAFTFATALADAAAYDVTVATQPATKWCLVLNGTGTIASANVTDVSVACKSWTHPADISDNISPDGQHAEYPRVAMDDSGNTIIVWEQSDGANKQVFKSEYRNGVWTHPSGLTDNISGDLVDAFTPHAAMDNNGDAIIVFRQSDGANPRILRCEYRNNTWCTTPEMISPAGSSAYSPKVAMDNNGDAIIVWRQFDSGNKFQTFKSEYRNGAWTDPANIDDNISPDGQSGSNPEVAMDDNGNAIIAWEQNDGANDQVFKSEYRNGTWTIPSSLSDNISPDGQNADDPQVAMDDNGNAIIIWRQNDGANVQTFKAEYRGGSWTYPSGLSDNISIDGQHTYDPQVAMDDDGNAIIVWDSQTGVTDQIFKSEYRNGTWVHPASLSDNISPDDTDTDLPALAMDDNGNAIIVWYQDDSAADAQVFKSEYRNGAWTHPSSIDDNVSPDGQDTDELRVAMSNNGDAVIVWYQSDGVNNQIYMSEFR